MLSRSLSLPGSDTLERGAMMFQLFDLIMTSPIGVFLFAKAQDAIYAALVISDCDECGFNDLGKLLFGGLALALLVGVGASVLYWKKKEKQEILKCLTEQNPVQPRQPQLVFADQ